MNDDIKGRISKLNIDKKAWAKINNSAKKFRKTVTEVFSNI